MCCFGRVQCDQFLSERAFLSKLHVGPQPPSKHCNELLTIILTNFSTRLTQEGVLYLVFSSFSSCFALEQRESKAKHCRNVLGQKTRYKIGPSNIVQTAHLGWLHNIHCYEGPDQLMHEKQNCSLRTDFNPIISFYGDLQCPWLGEKEGNSHRNFLLPSLCTLLCFHCKVFYQGVLSSKPHLSVMIFGIIDKPKNVFFHNKITWWGYL